MQWIYAQAEVAEQMGVVDWYKMIMMIVGHGMVIMTIFRRLFQKRVHKPSALALKLQNSFSRPETPSDSVGCCVDRHPNRQLTRLTRLMDPRSDRRFRIVLDQPRSWLRPWRRKPSVEVYVTYIDIGDKEKAVKLVEGKDYLKSDRSTIIAIARAALGKVQERQEADRRETERAADEERAAIAGIRPLA